GTYVLTSAPAHDLALYLPGEKHTAFTGRLIRLLHEGIPDGPGSLTIDDLYQALLVRMRTERLPEPQNFKTHTAGLLPLIRNRPSLSPEQVLVRSLREHTATREQLLGLFGESDATAIHQWLHAPDMTAEMRRDALALVLARLDAAAANAVASHWRAVGGDVL